VDLNLWPDLREHLEISDAKQFHIGALKTGNEVFTKFKISKSSKVLTKHQACYLTCFSWFIARKSKIACLAILLSTLI
jgi:hypothetical protein